MLTVWLCCFEVKIASNTHTGLLTKRNRSYAEEPYVNVKSSAWNMQLVITLVQESPWSILSGLPFLSDSLNSSQSCICLLLNCNLCHRTPYLRACPFTCLDFFILCLVYFCDCLQGLLLPRLSLNSWLFCPYLPSAKITDIYSYIQAQLLRFPLKPSKSLKRAPFLRQANHRITWRECFHTSCYIVHS